MNSYKKHFALSYLIVVAMMTTLPSCSESKATDGSETLTTTIKNVVVLNEQQFKLANIQSEPIEKKPISTIVRLNGKIDLPPQNAISISIPMGGYLKSTDLLEGSPIKKGQVLAILEDSKFIELQQEYLTAKAQFAMNENEYKRQRALNESKTTSDKVFEQVKANYEMQQITIKSLEQKLRLIGLTPENIQADNITRTLSIISPINGYVTSIHANIGKYISPGEILFELVDPSSIHLVLTAYEKDIQHLSVGQKLIAYSNSSPEVKYPCTIKLINPNLSNQNAVTIHCTFDSANASLLPGMFMNAEIEVSSKHSKALPTDAIVRYENKHFAFIDGGNYHYEMMEVVPGASENGYTSIELSDEISNARFVTHGAYNLLMAMKNVMDEE
jgi:cobalt-zinc-cadmium efflux system membrane fusion protein